ncbi:diguanylate cyclase [Pararhizobium sp. YC-54]|uniref:GGDEF domain-containing protein n=1 Tax=Pararhizobium sp. YC-54 TaxID=2986920 RepID=UPI0021F731B8|nr:diguanylate cyclase [Pararhizobium sp. YC-54]MCW0002333.1 diguanylate cyclase [Pararhizobium sp. YC-54]
MNGETLFNGNRDWRIARNALGGILLFAFLAQLLTYLSLVALMDRPIVAAMLGSAVVSLLMGAPLVIALAVQSRRVERLRNQINHDIYHDGTTGCVTGRGLVQHVNGLERRRQRSGASLEGALVQVRINNLDEVGSSYGPQWSDELLQFVASTISTSIRRDDIVARTGPATFDVLLVGASELDANQVCTRLTKALVSSHFSADGKAVDLALSVGGVLFDGNIDLARLRHTASSEAIMVAAGQAPAVALARLPTA